MLSSAKPVLAAILLISSCGVSRGQTGQAQNACKLRILVVDYDSGRPLRYQVTSFLGPVALNLAKRFKDMEAPDLACGTYRYVLEPVDPKDDLPNIRGTVYLQDRFQQVTVVRNPFETAEGTFSAQRAPNNSRLAGRVVGPIPRTAWVRFIAMAGGYTRDVGVSESGEFEVYALEPGVYLVLAQEPMKVLAATYISHSLGNLKQIEIRIEGR